MIRILVVDDVKILRECIKITINKDEVLKVVGCASNGQEAVEMTRALKPDVVLMDLNMPIYSGQDAIYDIKSFSPKTKILVLTVEGDEVNIMNAFKNGADGYVLKDIDPSDLFNIIKNAYRGEKYINENAFYISDDYIYRNKKIDELDNKHGISLTDREKDVLKFVVEGMTNEEIANEISVSAGRARNIVADLISKFMVKNRTQLAVAAVKLK